MCSFKVVVGCRQIKDTQAGLATLLERVNIKNLSWKVNNFPKFKLRCENGCIFGKDECNNECYQSTAIISVLSCEKWLKKKKEERPGDWIPQPLAPWDLHMTNKPTRPRRPTKKNNNKIIRLTKAPLINKKQNKIWDLDISGLATSLTLNLIQSQVKAKLGTWKETRWYQVTQDDGLSAKVQLHFSGSAT